MEVLNATVEFVKVSQNRLELKLKRRKALDTIIRISAVKKLLVALFPAFDCFGDSKVSRSRFGDAVKLNKSITRFFSIPIFSSSSFLVSVFGQTKKIRVSSHQQHSVDISNSSFFFSHSSILLDTHERQRFEEETRNRKITLINKFHVLHFSPFVGWKV